MNGKIGEIKYYNSTLVRNREELYMGEFNVGVFLFETEKKKRSNFPKIKMTFSVPNLFSWMNWECQWNWFKISINNRHHIITMI
jgi:hypothetical protein